MKFDRSTLLRREELEVFEGEAFEAEENYEEMWVKGKNMSGKIFPAIKIDGSVLEQTDLGLCKLDKLKLIDSEVLGSNLANMDAFEAFFLRVVMTENRMTGTRLNKLIATDWKMNDVKANLMQMRFGKIRKAHFIKCDFRNADFQATDLTGCVFEKCDLEEAEFSECKLKGTDFRGSNISNMRVGVEEIRGAVFDMEQAMKLLGLLGVEIKE
jgi:uncharacterized protein YjbI with pentapeptide repeats